MEPIYTIPEVAEYLQYATSGRGSTATARVAFDSTISIDTITASSIANVVSSAAQGFYIQALKPLVITLTYSDAGTSQISNYAIVVNDNTNLTTPPQNQPRGDRRGLWRPGSADTPPAISVTAQMVAGQYAWICAETSLTINADSNVQVVLTEIIQTF